MKLKFIRNMLLSREHKLANFAIPKNASKSLKYSLHNQNGFESVCVAGNTDIVAYQENKSSNRMTDVYNECKRDYRKFAVIRNPITRFLSAYSYFIALRKSKHERFARAFNSDTLLIENFLEIIEERKKGVFDMLFIQQTGICYDVTIDNWMLFDNLEDELRKELEPYGIQVNKVQHHNKCKIPLQKQLLINHLKDNKSVVNTILDIYSDDTAVYEGCKK